MKPVTARMKIEPIKRLAVYKGTVKCLMQSGHTAVQSFCVFNTDHQAAKIEIKQKLQPDVVACDFVSVTRLGYV